MKLSRQMGAKVKKRKEMYMFHFTFLKLVA